MERVNFPRKSLWFFSVLAGRLIWFLIIGLVILRNKLDHDQVVYLFVILFALTHFFGQLPASLWFSWMGDLVPANRTTQYWSQRNGVTQLFTFIASLAFGFAVDFFNGSGWSYVGVIGFSAVMGLAELFIQARVPDRSRGKPRLHLADFFEIAMDMFQTLSRFFLRQGQDRNNYLYFTLAFAIFSLTTWVFVPFPFIYLQRNMGMSQLQVQSFVAVTTAVSYLSTFFFRSYGPRFGMKPLLIGCFALKMIEMALWSVVNHPSMGLWYYVIFAIGGFVNIGIGIAQFSLLTRITSPENRSLLSALFFTCMGIVSFATANVSGVIYQSLERFSFPFLAGTFGPFHSLSLFNAVGLLPVIVLLFRFRETGSSNPFTLARALLSENPIRNVMQAQVLSGGLSEAEKGKSLSRASGNFFEEEWITSLDSPSSRIRLEALLSLGRHAAPSLKLEHKLAHLAKNPALGLQIPALYVIGAQQLRTQIPLLTQLGLTALRKKDPSILPVILSSLGRMDDPASLNLVKKVLQQKRWVYPWPFALEALGKIGTQNDLPLLLEIYGSGKTFSTGNLEAKMGLIAMSRLVEKESTLFMLFDREEKLKGSSAEELIGKISESFIGSKIRKSWHTGVIALHDAGHYKNLTEKILTVTEEPPHPWSSVGAKTIFQFLSRRLLSRKTSGKIAEAEMLALLWVLAREG